MITIVPRFIFTSPRDAFDENLIKQVNLQYDLDEENRESRKRSGTQGYLENGRRTGHLLTIP